MLGAAPGPRSCEAEAMTGGRRDVEADLRALLARDARACVKM
jgi:hypothetical protein